jgi:hypothetical protein
MTAAATLLCKDLRVAASLVVPTLCCCIVAWVAWVGSPALAAATATWWGGMDSGNSLEGRLSAVGQLLAAVAVLAPGAIAIAVVQGDRRRHALMLACVSPAPDWKKGASQGVAVVLSSALLFALYASNSAVLLSLVGSRPGFGDVTQVERVAWLAVLSGCLGLAGGLLTHRAAAAVGVGALVGAVAAAVSLAPAWVAIKMPGAPFGLDFMDTTRATPRRVHGSSSDSTLAAMVSAMHVRAQHWSWLAVYAVPAAVAACAWRRSSARSGRISPVRVGLIVLVVSLLTGGLATATAIARSTRYWETRTHFQRWYALMDRVAGMSFEQVAARYRELEVGRGEVGLGELARRVRSGDLARARTLGLEPSADTADAELWAALAVRISEEAMKRGAAEQLKYAYASVCPDPLPRIRFNQWLDRIVALGARGEDGGSAFRAHRAVALRALCAATDADERDALIGYFAACADDNWTMAEAKQAQAPPRARSWREVVETAERFLDARCRAKAGEIVPDVGKEEWDGPATWPDEVTCALEAVRRAK